MTRSRLVVLSSMIVVAVGVAAAVGALWLDPARAAVGPMPAQALVLPADARYVMGFDVKRFAASPFYQRYGSRKGMRPEALAELEAKTGLRPERDIDQIVVAGTPGARGSVPGVALVTGRFDLYKLGRVLETESKAKGQRIEGVNVYSYDEGGRAASAVAFLDETAILFGQKDRVEAALASRSRSESPLRGNATLLALVEKVRPGSTFWMVGDQSILAGMPTSIPAPGAPAAEEGGAGASISLPQLKSLTVTGDLDPQVSIAVTGEAADEAAAKNLADIVRGFVALASLQAAQKPELQQLASAFSVATEQNRVLLSARIPYAMIDALQAKVAPAAPKAAPVPAK